MTEAAAQESAVEAQLVDALMQTLVKALRATQLYLPNNPVYQQAMQNLRAAFQPVWQGTGELALGVAETDLMLDKRPVLAQPNKQDSVAWVLYKDGVRSVTLLAGVEEEEIARFLSMIHRARTLPPDADDDLLTLLWEQDFQLIRHDFVELGASDGQPLPPATEEPVKNVEEVQRTVQEEAAEPEPLKGIVSLEEFDATLYFLDDAERVYLQQEIEREYTQDLRGNVLMMLFDLLELQTYSTVRAEIISIVENFIPYLLAVGDFRSVAYICRDIHTVMQRARELLPEHRKALEELPGKLSQAEALAQLLQSLDEALVHPSEEELGELFREFRSEALGTILGWLPKLSNQRVRDLLYGAAQRLAQTYPGEVSKALETAEESVLLETVRLVARLKLPPVALGLGALFGRGSTAQVKVAVVEALAAIGTPGAMQQLEKGIDDPDRDVRISAVKVMAQRGHRGAFPKIEAAIDGKTLRNADLTEKMAFFEAFGAMAGPAGVPRLAAMLQGGGFLKRKEDTETRACAAMALGKIPTPEAKDVLQQVSKDKDALVRNAANKALREVR